MELNSELDILYSPSNWSSRRNQGMSNSDIIKDYCTVSESGSNAVIESKLKRVILPVTCERVEKDEEVFVFSPSDEVEDRRCLFAFIHGGYWVDGRSRNWSLFMAPTLSQNGIHYAAIGYQDYNNVASLEAKIQIVVQAVNQITDYASKNGIRSVIIGGHSAGGHLAASLICHQDITAVSQQLTKGLVLMSGVYDLVPLLNTSMFIEYPSLQVSDQKTAENLSPSYQLSPDKPITLTSLLCVELYVGGEESPGFHQQSTDMEQLLQSRGISTDRQTLPNLDHFNSLTSLGDPKSALSKLLVLFCHKVAIK